MAGSRPTYIQDNNDLSDDEAMTNDEIDRESNFSEDLLDFSSPVDGFARQHPQDRFVQESSAAKASEAAQERAAVQGTTAARYTPSPPRLVTTSSSEASGQLTPPSEADTSQQYGAGHAPPDYLTAISDRSSQGDSVNSPVRDHVPQGSSDYGTMSRALGDMPWAQSDHSPLASHVSPNPAQTFGNDHPLVRNGLLGAQHAQPQSMQDANSHIAGQHSRSGTSPNHSFPDERQHLNPTYGATNNNPCRGWRGSDERRGRRWLPSCKSRRWIHWLIAVVLVTAIFLIGRSAHSVFSGSRGSGSVNEGNGGKDGQSSPDRPGLEPSCYERAAMLKATTSFSSFGKDFSIQEKFQYKPEGPRQITGRISIQPASDSQEVDVEVEMYASVSTGWEVENINFSKTDNTLEILYPDLKRTGYFKRGGSMCLDIVLKIRPGLSLEDFNVETTHCSIYALKGLFKKRDEISRDFDGFHINGNSKLSTIAGAIRVESWNSRETYIRSTSGSVHGSFNLLDILSINTVSGSVDTTISPKEADKDKPRPAELTINTVSGSVKATNPTSGNLPNREYRTTIETTSGQIRGSFILGSQATFTTQSGSLNLDVLPFGSKVDNFHTSTASGSHQIRLLSPHTSRSSTANASEDVTTYKTGITKLASSHRSASGSLRVEYPREWEGTIDAESMAGSINVRGKDVHRTRGTSGSAVFNRFVGHKGDGDSNMLLRTAVGSINVLAGDDF